MHNYLYLFEPKLPNQRFMYNNINVFTKITLKTQNVFNDRVIIQ